MLLDGSVSEAKILDFLDMSYDLIDGKKDRIISRLAWTALEGMIGDYITKSEFLNLPNLNLIHFRFEREVK